MRQPQEGVFKIDFGNRDLKIEDGCLSVDSTSVGFDITARNVAIRAEVKRLSASDAVLGCRAHEDVNTKAKAAFGYSNSKRARFQIALCIDSKWVLASQDAQAEYNDFFKFEFITMENKFTAFANDQEVIFTVNPYIDEAGIVSVQSLVGTSLFRSIQVKILDE